MDIGCTNRFIARKIIKDKNFENACAIFRVIELLDVGDPFLSIIFKEIRGYISVLH